MTNSRRVLKSSDVAATTVVDIEPTRVDVPDEPLLFTASETEALCETARQSGAEDALAELAPLLQSIEATLRELAERTPESRSLAFRADSSAIIDTSAMLAEWVLGQELSSPELIAELVTQATAEHDVTGGQRLRLEPELASMVQVLLPDSIDIVADRSIPRGSFVLQTDGPEISLHVEAALDRARQALVAHTTVQEEAA